MVLKEMRRKFAKTSNYCKNIRIWPIAIKKWKSKLRTQTLKDEYSIFKIIFKFQMNIKKLKKIQFQLCSNLS